MDDDESNERNLELLKNEVKDVDKKINPSHDKLKDLMTRTFAIQRSSILESNDISVKSILEEYPLLKRNAYVSILNTFYNF